MGKFELNMNKEEILSEINMTLDEYENSPMSGDVASAILYEALVTAYNYILKSEKE